MKYYVLPFFVRYGKCPVLVWCEKVCGKSRLRQSRVYNRFEHILPPTVVRYRLQIVMMAAINSRIVPIRAGRASPIPGVAAEC